MAHAETRALLVGVSKFQTPLIPDLEGPANDLGDMEAMVRGQGVTDVTVLRDADVSRTTVETAIHALGLRAKPGDWIMFYYSGHGAEAEAAVKGTRDGERDQFVPLPKFDPDDQDPERYIVDKDFYAWFDRYVPRSAQILMIADTCHSGSLNRSADHRAFHFTPRLALRGQSADFTLTARPAPRFPAVLAASEDALLPGATIDRLDLPNLIYIGAAQDDQLALERGLPSDNAPSHGLLTYAFTQGLTTRGPNGTTLAADLNGDGGVSVSEMAVYLDTQVRALAADQQTPKVSYVTGKENVRLFAAVPPPQPTPTTVKPNLPSLFVEDPRGRTIAQGDNTAWTLAGDPSHADFLWDFKTGEVLRGTGDVVAGDVATLARLRRVLEKWSVVEALRPLLKEGGAKLSIGPLRTGSRYAPGAVANVVLRAGSTGASPGYATIFNLAADGTVQVLYPIAPADGEGAVAASGELPVMEASAVAPFGADHVVAIVTRETPAQFRALLRTLDGQPGAGKLVEPIRTLLARDSQASLSIAQLYTGK